MWTTVVIWNGKFCPFFIVTESSCYFSADCNWLTQTFLLSLLEQETWHLLLITGWFQDQIPALFIYFGHIQTKINYSLNQTSNALFIPIFIIFIYLFVLFIYLFIYTIRFLCHLMSLAQFIYTICLVCNIEMLFLAQFSIFRIIWFFDVFVFRVKDNRKLLSLM